MNFARITAAAVVAWIVSLGIGYLVNEVLFKDLFVSLPFYRPETDINGLLPVGFVFLLVGFFVFAYAFARYVPMGGVAEGIKFGLLIAIIADCFAMIWNYVMLPLPAKVAVAQMIDPLIEVAIYGAIVGAIYKPATKGTGRPASV